LKEFKETFSIVVCELELKYGANYTKVFAFKQLARYVHYEALDVYNQHSLRILGIIQIPNPAYATAITIARHGTMPNNPDSVCTSVNLYFRQLIVVIANIPPTINALAFVDPVGEFFRILELKFLVKSSEKNLQLATFRHKDETLKMLYNRLLKLKEDTQSIIDLEAARQYLRSLKGILTFHV
jgi:hypothetical protein